MIRLNRIINKLSILLVLLACLYLVTEQREIEYKQEEDIKNESLKRQGNIAARLLKGNIIARIVIDKISLNKVIVLSNQHNMQKNIDLNNVSTTNKLTDNNIVVYGHYTQIKNLVFNRIAELAKGDIIKVEDMTNTSQQYKIIGLGNSADLSKLTDQSQGQYLTIITCTTDFDKLIKYYVKAIKI